jgi:hypothetical protein
MSLRSFINFGAALPVAGGVNILVLNDGSLDISYSVLRKKKDWVSIVSSKSGITSIALLLEELTNHLPKTASIHINFEGKGILTKSTEIVEVVDSDLLVRKLFPMVKPEEFVSQIYQGDSSTVVSLCREDLLAPLETLKKYYTVVSLSLGVFITDQIIPLLQTSVVVSSTQRIEIKNEKINFFANLEPTDQLTEFLVGEDKLPSAIMLSYASAWYLFFQHSDSIISEPAWVEEERAQFQFKRNLFKACRIALMILLAGLAINSLVFFGLKSATDEMEMKARLVSSQNDASSERQKQLQALQTAYDQIGWKENVQPLYYADQIAASITTDITLTDLEIGVVDETILQKEKRLVYQPTRIKVAGLAITPVALNQWLAKIEALSWVKQITQQKYSHDARNNRGVFEFYLEIK